MVDLTYRTTDNTKWGVGQGTDLSATQIDNNFWLLQKAINDLIANPASPTQIVSITSSGAKLTFNMSDSTTIGPVYMPVLSFHWREVWQPSTIYNELDVFQVTGVGLYMVQLNHTSAATFDENATDPTSGDPLLLKLFAFAPAENLVYDMGFFYPGVLKDIPSSVTRIYEEPLARRVLLPVTPRTGSYHRAHLDVPPGTSAQDLALYQNNTSIGTLHVAVGANTGVITLTDDVTFDPTTDRLGVGRQAVDDAVAAGLSVVFAAQQVIG